MVTPLAVSQQPPVETELLVVKAEKLDTAYIDGKLVPAKTKQFDASFLISVKTKYLFPEVTKLVVIKVGGKDIELQTTAELEISEVACDCGTLFGVNGEPGIYQIKVSGVTEADSTFSVTKRLKIDGPPTPDPVDPVDPDDPTPDPDTLDKNKIKVMIIEESSVRSQLPIGQFAAIFSKDVRAKLNEICSKTDGKADWRVVDKDSDLSADANVWQQAMKLPRSSLPWLHISDGTKGVSMPVPTSEEEMLAILNRYSK